MIEGKLRRSLAPPRLKVGDYIRRGLIVARVVEILGERILCRPIIGDFVLDRDELFVWEGPYERDFIKYFDQSIIMESLRDFFLMKKAF